MNLRMAAFAKRVQSVREARVAESGPKAFLHVAVATLIASVYCAACLPQMSSLGPLRACHLCCAACLTFLQSALSTLGDASVALMMLQQVLDPRERATADSIA